MKPMLACDAVIEKISFPMLIQPKIDGVRALVQNGRLLGRSLKAYRNKHANQLFGLHYFEGFDGEMAAGAMTDSDLCRKTTSALNSYEGQPDLVYHVFDYVLPETIDMPYERRFEMLRRRVQELFYCHSIKNVQVVPSWEINDVDEIYKANDYFLEQGFEGSILRDPRALHKQGRVTAKEASYLRVKTFKDAEAEVIEVIEGQHNANEAKINELGYIERSTHQENMIPNGMVGKLICRDLETGSEVTVSPGKMTHQERKHYLENQSEIVGKIVKYKFFPRGIKDKPRHATFQCIRSPIDMGGE